MSKKTYFDTKNSDYSLQITESYIKFTDSADDESIANIIPVNSISYISVRKEYVRWWITVLLVILVFVLHQTYFYEFQTIALVFAVLSLAYNIIISLRRYIYIYSHSQNYIRINISWLKRNKCYEPLLSALHKVIEDNNILNIKDNTSYQEV